MRVPITRPPIASKKVALVDLKSTPLLLPSAPRDHGRGWNDAAARAERDELPDKKHADQHHDRWTEAPGQGQGARTKAG
jgi:hypothetical protein